MWHSGLPCSVLAGSRQDEQYQLPLAELVKRYEAAGGRYYVCPICFNAKNLGPASLISGAELQGTIPLWAWIGDEAATTFSY